MHLRRRWRSGCTQDARPTVTRVLRLAFSSAALRRTVPAMVVVGSILTAVNSGGRLVDGDVDGGLVVKTLFTFAVPFANATYGFVTGVRADDAPAG